MQDTTKLKESFDWYLENQNQLVKKYNNRILLIHNKEVVGDFNDKMDAYTEGMGKYTPGEFLIIKCTPGNKEYTINYRSRYRLSPMGAEC